MIIGDALLAKTRDKEAVTAYYFAFSSEVNKVLGTNNPSNRKSGIERGNKTGTLVTFLNSDLSGHPDLDEPEKPFS